MTQGTAENHRLNRLASQCSLGLACALIGIKLWAWGETGSVALLTSAIDAMVDAGAALVTFIGVRFAAQPADEDHRFGHGKGEALAAFVQGLFLAGAAVTLSLESIGRLITPQPLEHLGFGMWIMLGSTLAAAGLVWLQSWVVARTQSTAIAADRAHYLTDVAVNLAALAALMVVALTNWHRADPAFALGIAGYMLWNAKGIAQSALEQLLDHELSEPDRDRIRAAVLACAEVREIHDLRSRDAGDRVFIEFHLEVDGNLSVTQGHEISHVVESAVTALFETRTEVVVHIEPAGIQDDRLDAVVRSTASATGSHHHDVS